ncbi:hypothetical protein D3C72_2320760 [compost metagenome]
MPAACSISNAEIWPAEPTPWVPTVMLPGLFLAAATRSSTLWIGLSACTLIVPGSSTRFAMKSKLSSV